jgi:hypothetical protein
MTLSTSPHARSLSLSLSLLPQWGLQLADSAYASSLQSCVSDCLVRCLVFNAPRSFARAAAAPGSTTTTTTRLLNPRPRQTTSTTSTTLWSVHSLFGRLKLHNGERGSAGGRVSKPTGRAVQQQSAMRGCNELQQQRTKKSSLLPSLLLLFLPTLARSLVPSFFL